MMETIVRITVLNGRRMARTDARKSYFIGPVGAAVGPWLKKVQRSEGVDLYWPDDLLDVEVVLVLTDQPVDEYGWHPMEHAPWSALGATDMPREDATATPAHN